MSEQSSEELSRKFDFFERICRYWVYGTLPAAIVLILLAPLLMADMPKVVVISFLALPAYMIHQFEEHDRDRFRIFFNQTIAGGKESLSSFATFMVNVPGVWGLITISFAGALNYNPGFCLISIYLLIINAIIHILHALLFRCYNPGLLTAIILFVPLGIYHLICLNDSCEVALKFHFMSSCIKISFVGIISCNWFSCHDSDSCSVETCK